MSVLIDGSAGITTNTGAVYNGLQSTTAVASTSGTSILFTGIPLWVKRITVMLNGVSLSGTSLLLVQIGSGSVTTSGYASGGGLYDTASTITSSTSGFVIKNNASAALSFNGTMTLTNISGNSWVSSHVWGNTSSVGNGAGNITLAGSLDRVNITTVAGTDAFDAGTINLIYE